MTSICSKPPAGQMQSDYRRKAEEGPRSEIDNSPININMGTNPKKQSMSFKVLQWMTDTENTPDDPGQLASLFLFHESRVAQVLNGIC